MTQEPAGDAPSAGGAAGGAVDGPIGSPSITSVISEVSVEIARAPKFGRRVTTKISIGLPHTSWPSARNQRGWLCFQHTI